MYIIITNNNSKKTEGYEIIIKQWNKNTNSYTPDISADVLAGIDPIYNEQGRKQIIKTGDGCEYATIEDFVSDFEDWLDGEYPAEENCYWDMREIELDDYEGDYRDLGYGYMA